MARLHNSSESQVWAVICNLETVGGGEWATRLIWGLGVLLEKASSAKCAHSSFFKDKEGPDYSV